MSSQLPEDVNAATTISRCLERMLHSICETVAANQEIDNDHAKAASAIGTCEDCSSIQRCQTNILLHADHPYGIILTQADVQQSRSHIGEPRRRHMTSNMMIYLQGEMN